MLFSKSKTHSPNYIANPFRLLVCLLKILGNSPIEARYTTSGTQKQIIVFEVNWKSWKTVASGVVGIASLSVWISFLLNISFGTSFLTSSLVSSKDIDSVLNEEPNEASWYHTAKLTFVFTSMGMSLEIVTRWCTGAALIKFLNSWSAFQRDLELAFPNAAFKWGFDNIVQARDKLLLYYVAYPSAIIYPYFLAVFCFNLSITAKFLVTFMFIQLSVVSLSEDVILLLSYKTISESFAQVHKCVVTHRELKQPLTVSVVQSWRLLVLGVRNRAHQLGGCNEYAELNRFMGTLANLTLSIYVILNGWDHAAKSGQMLFCMVMLGYSIVLVGRTYLKAMMAERITQEELLLGQTLVEITTTDVNCLAEVKYIVDMIYMKPAKIELGNYVVLNKRLCLKILGQVMTYLIVLMQFTGPKYQSPG